MCLSGSVIKFSGSIYAFYHVAVLVLLRAAATERPQRTGGSGSRHVTATDGRSNTCHWRSEAWRPKYSIPIVVFCLYFLVCLHHLVPFATGSPSFPGFSAASVADVSPNRLNTSGLIKLHQGRLSSWKQEWLLHGNDCLGLRLFNIRPSRADY